MRINVGSEMVADGIPPWIARRRMGEDVDVSIDVAQRQLFYQYLRGEHRRAVAEFRGQRAPARAVASTAQVATLSHCGRR